MSEKNNYSLEDFVLLLIRWKKLIITSFVISVFAAIVFTSPFFLPPQYKSEIIFYPPSNYSGKLMLDLYFGVDKEIDEEIQILKSSILRDSLIVKYKLMEHYQIDPTGKYKLNELHEKFNNNIKIERTRYNSISVIVFDTDPVLAANMANDMVRVGDEVKYTILKQNFKEIYSNTEIENLKQLKVLDTLSEQINGIDNNMLKIKKINTNETNNLDLLKAQMEIRDMIKNAIENKNYKLLNILYQFETKFNQFNEVKGNLKEINKKLNSENVNSFIITPAEAADKKSYPIRSLIVFLIGMGSVLISIVLVLLLEKFKEVQSKLVK